MNAKKINGFEKLAWECEIRKSPGDKTQALAFTDWLCERGFTLMGAKCLVTRLVREGTEEIQRVRVEKLLAEDGTTAMRARRAVRMSAGLGRGVVVSIEVVSGGHGPERVGDLGYFATTAGDQVIPGDDWDGIIENLEWIDGPLRVVVGAAWVLRALENAPSHLVV